MHAENRRAPGGGFCTTARASFLASPGTDSETLPRWYLTVPDDYVRIQRDPGRQVILQTSREQDQDKDGNADPCLREYANDAIAIKAPPWPSARRAPRPKH